MYILYSYLNSYTTFNIGNHNFSYHYHCLSLLFFVFFGGLVDIITWILFNYRVRLVVNKTITIY